jgi:hypothetical protein
VRGVGDNRFFPRRPLLGYSAPTTIGRMPGQYGFMERTMLSPHEFATLLLVKDAPNQVDMDREELNALLERQLVALEDLASGRQQWRITASGDSALKAIERCSQVQRLTTVE